MEKYIFLCKDVHLYEGGDNAMMAFMLIWFMCKQLHNCGPAEIPLTLVSGYLLVS